MRRLGWIGACAAALCVFAGGLTATAQTTTRLVEPEAPLLPASFGVWQSAAASDVPQQTFSLVTVNKDALEECNPQRSKTADFIFNDHGNVRHMHVEAVEFNDATGAYSAFTLALRPGLRIGQQVGSASAVGEGGVLFQSGSVLVLANPASAADVAELKKLEVTLPKAGGTRRIAPLLPSLLPTRGLVPASVRYALGPISYAVGGGKLPAGQLGWEKSGEAASADFNDKRGKETLTLLLYPTPQIAGEHMRALEAAVGASGAKVRREGELVAVAQGSFSADDAQNLVENAHLHNVVSFDKPMPLECHAEVQKTYSLMQSIFIFSAVGGLAAVTLGFFLGFGRAAIRKLQGKDAATEGEFLSLHLDPQNAKPKFEKSED